MADTKVFLSMHQPGCWVGWNPALSVLGVMRIVSNMGQRHFLFAGRRVFRQTVLAVVILLSAATSSSADEVRQITPFFDGLRQRELFGVAERYAIDRRAELPVESAESVQLAVELSRTFSEHARRVADQEEQSFLQQRAEEALADYDGTKPVPRIEAVTLERVFRSIDRADAAWWSWTADPDDQAARRDAAARYETSLAALESWIVKRVERRVAQGGTDESDDELTSRELSMMRHAAELKKVELLLASAELIENGSERVRLLRQAEDAIEKVRGSAERGTTIALRNHSIRIARLQGDSLQLQQLVRQAKTDRTPIAFRQAAIAELARHELDQRYFEAAAKVLVDAKASLGEVSNQLRALHVEAVLGMWRSAGAQRSQFLASAQKEQAEVTGPWRLRNEFLLQQVEDIQKFGEEAEALLRRGRREYRAGQRDDAITSFAQAAEVAAVPAGRAELHFMVASLLVKADRFQEAIAACEKSKAVASSSELAARASLLAAYCQGRISSSSQNPRDNELYERSLVEHLRRFPQDATTGDAAWMLGTLAEQGGRLAAVVDADQLVPSNHPRFADSLARTARVLNHVQDQLRASGSTTIEGRSVEQWGRDAERTASKLLSTESPANQPPDPAAAERSLTAAKLLLGVPAPRFDEVLALLDRVTRRTPETSPSEEWQRVIQEAAALRLVCLTATGRYADAAATLEQLRSVSIGELLNVLRQLSSAGRQLTGPARRELAKLELTTIARIRLQGAELSPDDGQLLLECEAEALYASGQFGDAARLFAVAVVARPALLPRLADSLDKTGQPADLALALKHWQDYEAKQPQGTLPWFEARLRIAKCLLRLGQFAECRKVVVSTRLAYPQVGSPELKAGFEAVEKQAAEKR